MEVKKSRRWKRFATNVDAVVLFGGRRIPCTIVDLSEAGAKLKLTDWVAPRARIHLLSEKFASLEASVVWSQGELAGIRFSEPPYQVVAKLKPLLTGLAAEEARAGPPRPKVVFGRRTQHGSFRK